MVVPDRVVQAQRLVALAPLISRPFVPVEHDRGHAELTQSGTERDTALTAADHHHIGLHGLPERGVLRGALLGPRPRIGVVTVHGAHDARRALPLLVAL